MDSDFLCNFQRAWLALGFAASLPCCGTGDSTSSVGPPRFRAEVAEPGVCAGEHTACSLPAAMEFQIGPEVSCELSDGGKAEIAWSAELGQIDCPYSRCVAAGRDIAVGEDGGIWVVSDLFLLGTDIFTGAPVGIGIHHFDAQGRQTIAQLADFSTPLASVRPRTSGVATDAMGQLSWLAPTTGRPSLELRKHDALGQLMTRRPLVEEVSWAQGFIGADGSSILAYRYPRGAPTTADPTSAGWDTDVARFDATRGLLWNQTASSIFKLGKRDLLSIDVHSGESDAPVFLRGRIEADTAPQLNVLAQLDSDGNVAWIREHEDAEVRGRALPGGGAAVRFRRTYPPGEPTFLVKVDASGTSEWALDIAGLGTLGGLGAPSIPTFVDRQGRIWGAERGLDSGYRVHALSADGRRCVSWELEPSFAGSFCDDNGGPSCRDVVWVAAEGGAAHFTGSTTVGLARFGGVP